MKAAVLEQANRPLTIEQIDIDQPRDNEVLVRVVASGVCHSDLHFIDGSWRTRYPVVLGHEAAGVVEQVGQDVTYVTPGDHVVISFHPFCGTCRFCVSGRPNLCQSGQIRKGEQSSRLTRDGQPITQFAQVGSFAEYVLVNEGGVVKIRKDAPLDKVALVGCGVTTGVGAVINTAKVEPGSKVAVIGAGGVGLNVIQGANLAGAAQIIAIDMLDNKLEMARTFGATDTVNASKSDPVEAVKELTSGELDYSFEVIGNTRAMQQAYDMVGRGGTMVVVGMAPLGSHLEIDPVSLFFNEKTIKGCYYGSTRARVDMPKLVDLYMAGKLKLDELVSRTYPLEGVNDAFTAMQQGEVARSILSF